jgi:hypothetical protein
MGLRLDWTLPGRADKVCADVLTAMSCVDGGSVVKAREVKVEVLRAVPRPHRVG